MKDKKALIAVNVVGFVGFLWNDIDLLQEKGYRIYLIADTVNIKPTIENELVNRGVVLVEGRIHSKNPFDKINLKYFLKIQDLLETHHFDVIHCHTPIVGLLVRCAAAKYRHKGVKVIYTTHGLAFTHLSGIKERLIYKTMEYVASWWTDAVITINKEDWAAMKKMHIKRVYMIYGVGVDASHNRDVIVDRYSYRNEIGCGKNDILVLSVGELSVRKNHAVIIRAISEIPNKQQYVYAIAGRGFGTASTENHLKNLAQQLGVRLCLLGFRDDIPQLIHSSDIGAIPSIREGLGLAGIQSLCAGIPLVGSNVQGIKDYILNQETGFVCDPFDVDAFKTNIIKLSTPSVRNGMKSKCIEMAERFDVSVSKAQMAKIYNEIIGQ